MIKFPHFLISLVPCFAVLAGKACAAPASLFDGKSLTNWEGGPVWRVVDGTISGGSLEGNPRNEFLATKDSWRNFRLTLEYKLTGTEGFVNGGVQFRSQRIAEPANEMSGYQADIGAGYSGCLYDESRRNTMLAKPDEAIVKKAEKPGEWNRYEIRATDERIQIFLNGVRTVNYTESSAGIPLEGRIALQIHGQCKAVIAFRNIEIETLPENGVPEPEEILNRFGDAMENATRPTAFVDGKFLTNPGEVIVLTGQTNLVRQQKSGDLEARLGLALAAQAPRFRSMAWEGDTVYEQWRDLNFGDWNDQLNAVGAGMVIAQFGQVESFDGPARLAEFTAAYHRLLDQFAVRTPRLVLLSPMPFEKPVASHAPDLTVRNSDVAAYAEAVRRIAAQRGALYVDLFTPLSQRPAGSARLTDNGQHLNAEGLRVVAELAASQLGLTWSGADILTDLKAGIVEKNRLWADCWRPANWSFVYGDRVTQLFGKAGANAPSLRAGFELHKPLIAIHDARISAMASGKRPPALPPDPPAPPAGPVLTAAQEQASFTVAVGYEVNLFASENEDVSKPVQMSWDERGRCYIACSPTYPQTFPGEKPRDYILIVEDTDHDGKADRHTRFAEGLTMVQGVEPGDGGVYVCDFDQLLHFKDTDGDGKADVRRVLYSGFGIGDTHQLINSICHGPDGTLWFSQGLHAFSRVESDHGLAVLERSGLWRYQPRTGKLEGFFNGAKAGHNCWGVAFDDNFQVFHKSGDRPAGYFSTPGLVSMKDPDEYHPIGALFDTNPKTTSLDFVGTAAMPAELQGCAVIGGYFGGVVERHRLEDDGSGFKSTQLPRLLTSTESAFRPVDVSMGPDGALYLCDWFNPAIGHYQNSWAAAARDRSHGRIWRISAKGLAPVRPPDLAGMDPAALIGQLGSPERWVRQQAKRLLFDGRPEAVLAACDAALPAMTDPRLLMELCGVYQSHIAARPELVRRLAASPLPAARAYAMRAAGDLAGRADSQSAGSTERRPSEAQAGSIADVLTILKTGIHDPEARVRLEAVVACARVPGAGGAAVAVQVLDRPTDKFLDYALRQTVRSLQDRWQNGIAGLDLGDGPGRGARLNYLTALASAKPEAAAPGKVIYDTLCLNCHQPEGHGLAGIYPPISQSDWVTGPPDRLVKILTHGLAGPIRINNQPFNQTTPLPMPPMGLDDAQLADVLTYIRSGFGNHAEPITAETVRQIRSTEETKIRTTFWTETELNP
ncbi:MAG: putative rane-bound dehydrogenase protein [Verrucomicrobiales bacterium]|nr:putative rane-bound dehydrogenase protein [Verrucomicrobiales bacterium]